MVGCTLSLNESGIKLKIQRQISYYGIFFIFSSWSRRRVRKTPPAVSGDNVDTWLITDVILPQLTLLSLHPWNELEHSSGTWNRTFCCWICLWFAPFALWFTLRAQFGRLHCASSETTHPPCQDELFCSISMLGNHKLGQWAEDEPVI